MGINLATAVMRHINRVHDNPATAVDPNELDELRRYAWEDLQDCYVAQTSPVAKYSFMSRLLLDPAADESDTDTIDSLGEPIEIVGFDVQLLQLSVPTINEQPDPPITSGIIPQSFAGRVPIEAVDVQITRTKGGRDVLTAANQQPKFGQPAPLFVPLKSVSATIGNRLLRWRIDTDDALISFKYRWAVSAAFRELLGYTPILVSTTLMYRVLKEEQV